MKHVTQSHEARAPDGAAGDSRARAYVHVSACSDYAAAHVVQAVAEAMASLGGIGAFVRPGSTVLLKPNLLSVRPPEDAVTTHPAVVRAVADLCRGAGAGRLWIGDSPAGRHDEHELWRVTGMSEVARATGAELRSLQGPVTPVPCGGAVIPLPAWLAEVDVVISLPKLKTHTLTGLTAGMKNVFGLVAGNAKAMSHRHHASPRAMAAWLLQVYSRLRPQLTLVDGVIAMEGDGPSAGRPVPLGLLLAGADAAAIDLVAARLLGCSDGRGIPMLELALARELCPPPGAVETGGSGVARLARSRLRPSKARYLQRIPEPLFRWVTMLVSCRPQVQASVCTGCGVCIGVCPQRAIQPGRGPGHPAPRIDARRCILCVCCAEACPQRAITVRSPVDAWNRWRERLRLRGKKRALASGE